jgi:hypothetical protein
VSISECIETEETDTHYFDSVGVGELPDADIYGDQGTNTISNIP